MFLGHQVKYYAPWAIASALLYTATSWIYIYKGDFNDSWILYLGNFLFGATMFAFVFYFYRRFVKTRSISKMVIAAHLTSIIGIVIACLLAALGLMFFSPDVFAAKNTAVDDLVASPAQMQPDRNDGLVMILYVNAIVGNAGMGFLVGLIFPFAIMRNQKGNKEGENQGPGKPVSKLKRTVVDSLDQPIKLNPKN